MGNAMKLDSILDMVKKTAITEYTTAKTGKASEKQPTSNIAYGKDSGLLFEVEDTVINKKSILEGLEALEKTDLETQQNFMAVMSNTISQGDFQQMMKEGYSFSDSEVEHIVTVVDKIKIKLAQAGVNTVYTRDVSLEDMASVLGSEGQAIQVAGELANPQITDMALTGEEVNLPESMVEFTYESPMGTDDLAEANSNLPASMEIISAAEDLIPSEKSFGSLTNPNENLEILAGTKEMPEFVFQDTKVQTEEELYDLIANMLTENDLPITKENMNEIVQSLQLALEITDLSESAVKFMLENNLEPTIMNVYRAEFSSGNVENTRGQGYYTDTMPGYYAKKSNSINWQTIQGQMERVIDQAGLEVNEKTMEQAKWLVERGIPLTEEILAKYVKLKEISFPLQAQDILTSIISGMKEGNTPKRVLLNDKQDKIAKALEVQEKLQSISEDALKNTILSGKALTLENLTKEQNVIEENQNATFIYSSVEAVKEDAPELITARRQLEEVRLMMTVQASVRMMKQGIDVETTELSQLVEDLRQIEENYQKSVFQAADIPYTEEAGKIFAETNRKVESLAFMPMHTIGRFIEADQQPTINEIHEYGAAQQASMEAANNSYETMMTVPRSDLGDSIYKAFQNIDEILRQLSLESTQSNERAVKILAFNRMPVSVDNIQRVKQADVCMNRLMNNMSGEVTLELIRRGRNPLDTDIYHLNDEVEEIRTSLGNLGEEKYSEFLWRAERNQSITENERNAYIGIYRLFHQIEKSQGSVVGALVAQGAELTLRNLISGVKTANSKGIRAVVDDKFGGVSAGKSEITPIKEQINAGFSQSDNQNNPSSDHQQAYSDQQKQIQYYNTLVKEAIEEIQPEKLAQIPDLGKTDYTLENFYDLLKNLPENQQMQKQVYQEKMTQLQEARTIENNVIKMLLDFEQPITINNLTAADSLMNQRGRMIKRLMTEASKTTKKNKEKEILEAAERVTDHLVSKETAEAAYEKLTSAERELVEAAMEEEGLEYVDVRSLQMLHHQIQLAGRLSREENYEIPVEINNEITSINLKIIRGSNRDGNVAITMECEKYGKIAASFHVKADRITGLMVSDTQEGYDFLRSCDKDIKIGMAGESYRVTKLNYAKSDSVDLNKFSEIERTKKESQVNTAALYQCARAFIGIVRERNRV